jgi:hypothetical protein
MSSSPGILLLSCSACQALATLAFCCAQMLAGGNCIDGSICGAGKAAATCRAGTTLQRKYSPEEAMHSAIFSSAYKVFGPGTHTILIRANSYMACGTGSVSDCYGSAPVAFKAITSEHCPLSNPDIVLQHYGLWESLCLWLLMLHADSCSVVLCRAYGVFLHSAP